LPEVYEALNKTKSLSEKLLKIKELKDYDIETPLKTSLYDFQKVEVKFLIVRGSGFTFSEMGCGKSIVSLAVALIQRKGFQKSLIICPASVKSSWGNEIEKHTYNEKYLILEGNAKERPKILEKFFSDLTITFLILNYELLRQDVLFLEGYTYSTIIADEVIRFKHQKTQTSKALKRLKSQYRIGLSGYPVDNSPLDIYNPVDWACPGYLGSQWAFEDLYTQKVPMKVKDKKKDKDKKVTDKKDSKKKREFREFKMIVGFRNLAHLKKKLDPLYIRHLKSEVLDLPPQVFQVREIKLKGKTLEEYTRMRDEMRVRIQRMDNQEVEVKAHSVLIQLLRLSQLTDSFLTDESLKHPEWFGDCEKIKELDSIIEEVTASSSKVVIWSRWVPMVLKLYERYKNKYKAVYISGDVPVEDRGDVNHGIIGKFSKDPECKCFIGQIQSG
ncbi:unnamed protein product, partial [marine sediment metagenome]